jgi:polysaccharide export outer membrane protein
VQISKLGISLFLLIACGCNSIWNGWLDPTQVGRFRETTLTMDLRRSISVSDEPSLEMEASEPTAADLQVQDRDYVLRPGDVIDISIFELMIPGQPWVEYRQVSREGYITLPQISEDIYVTGKTARELEKHIKEVLRGEQVLSEPEVTILTREARNMTYNILGAVGLPGSTLIPRPNFRILDALSAAGGVSPAGGPMQPLVKTVYIFRTEEVSVDSDGVETEFCPAEDEEGMPLELAVVEDDDLQDDGGHWVYTDGEWKFVRESVEAKPKEAESAESAEPLEDESVVTKPSAPETAEPVPAEPVKKRPAKKAVATTGEGWEEAAANIPGQRVIAIPLDKLVMGDPRYNVVIQDGDTIWVPPPMQGEFYLMGNVLRPGVFSLTGREITIRQAISAAGGLSPLADPSRAELIRRIGGNQEQILSINIDRIFAGKEPDIILKPDDVLNVGSNPLMPFLAVLRNAFRATYGFGFVYDRNFADIDSFEGQSNPRDLRRIERQQRFGF